MPTFLRLWSRHFPMTNPRVAVSEFGGPDSGTLFSPYFDTSDFDAAAKAIFEMADFVENVEAPLEVAKEIARRDMAERFETEMAPNGRAWAALDVDYEIWKNEEVGDKPILTLYGDLSRQATSEGAWSVSGNSVWFDTSELPPYWTFHQYGGGEDLSFTPTGGAQAGEFIEIPGGNPPPRPFIGLSNEAEAEILAMLDIWFETGMKRAEAQYKVGSKIMSGGNLGTITGVTKRGQAIISVPGIGSRFGPKIT